jgi:hypothetical protein
MYTNYYTWQVGDSDRFDSGGWAAKTIRVRPRLGKGPGPGDVGRRPAKPGSWVYQANYIENITSATLGRVGIAAGGPSAAATRTIVRVSRLLDEISS